MENIMNQELQQQIDVMDIKLSKMAKEMDDLTEKLQAFLTLFNENNKLMRQQNEKKTDTTTS
tara:strand:- start:2171 stop:2356 length:186 start_codon:yes stop_codon:yes gene_type:complete